MANTNIKCIVFFQSWLLHCLHVVHDSFMFKPELSKSNLMVNLIWIRRVYVIEMHCNINMKRHKMNYQ
jgi:hypothetical protein